MRYQNLPGATYSISILNAGLYILEVSICTCKVYVNSTGTRVVGTRNVPQMLIIHTHIHSYTFMHTLVQNIIHLLTRFEGNISFIVLEVLTILSEATPRTIVSTAGTIKLLLPHIQLLSDLLY